MKIGAEALARSFADPKAKVQPFKLPEHPKTVIPTSGGMAQDQALGESLSWAANSFGNLAFAQGYEFLGYAYLAQLAQVPEYRRISERIATEMTRKWIVLKSAGTEDKTEKVNVLEQAMKDLKVKQAFREAALQDGFFGRSHLYLDTGDTDNREELKKPLGNGRDELSRAKIGKDKLKRIQPVEAVWCYPSNYNSNNPLAADWYKPSVWVVQGVEMHASRLLTFVGREVPDLLKPAYSFGGLSLSQMAKPYVDNWLETRQGVSDIIQAFSQFVLSTKMAEAVNTNPTQVFDRATFFNNMRNNRGLLLIDKDMEGFENISAPLGTLDTLQAQAQEHMASVSGIPLVILLGIQPAGLNASSEGELQAFYAWIEAYQEALFDENLKKVIDFIQLSKFGEVDPDITYSWEPLWSMSEKEISEIDKNEAEADAIRIESGVIDPMEARKRVAADPDSGYAGLDVEDDAPPTPSKPGEDPDVDDEDEIDNEPAALAAE